jgi:CRP/FNR family transcriptional regulator
LTAAPVPVSALSGGSERSYKRRSYLFYEGDPAEAYGVVTKGRVKLVRTHASGKETILDIVEEGGVLCTGATWLGGCYCCSAVADDDTVVRIIPREEVRAEVNVSPAIERLLDETAGRAAEMCQRVSESTCGRVDQRIASLLLRLSERRGEKVDGGVLLKTRLTRQDIADLCGTTVESAIRVMRRLEGSGILERREDGIWLQSTERLRDVLFA